MRFPHRYGTAGRTLRRSLLNSRRVRPTRAGGSSETTNRRVQNSSFRPPREVGPPGKANGLTWATCASASGLSGAAARWAWAGPAESWAVPLVPTIRKHNVDPAKLTILPDRGSSMRSKVVVQLLAPLDRSASVNADADDGAWAGE